jgi:hypothetical protein
MPRLWLARVLAFHASAKAVILPTTTTAQILLARVVVAAIVAFLVAGVLTYGYSAQVRERFWSDLIERPDHLMRFRFVLQPIMAALAALHDGVEDARTGRSPYIWTLLNSPSERVGRLAEGVISTARVLLFALCMDTVYQLIVLKTFYPAEAAAVAIALGFIPYLLLRGPIRRFVRWRRGGAPAPGSR